MVLLPFLMKLRLPTFRLILLFGIALASGMVACRPVAKSPRPPIPGKFVFAHYMVCIPTVGAGATVADYKKEIEEAQSRGIDGFVLNCGAWTDKEGGMYKKRTGQIYQAAKELGTDFKLFISADYATGLTLPETRDMVETFRNHPNQFRWQGKPVLSTFGGGAAQTEFVKKEFSGDRAIVYVPFYYPVPAAENPGATGVDQVFNANPSLDGFFNFGAAGTPKAINATNALAAKRWLGAGKIFMSPVSPFYRGLKGNYRVFESLGFQGMASEWLSAITNNANWIELTTWNDWGEASYVAPFGSPDNTKLWNGHWGGMLAHVAFLDASRYYIDWFKTGAPPEIATDRLFYFYRLHPKDVPGPAVPGQSGFPRGVEGLQDMVFVTAFLSQPGQVTVQSGTESQSFDLPAGVHHVDIPFQMGCPRVTLTRGGRTVIDKTGELPITNDGWSNFNYFSGSASGPPQ